MCNKDSKERIPAEIAVTFDCAVAVSARTISCSFTDSDPTDDSVGLASIVTREHRPPATDQLAEVASLTMLDTTDAVIPGVDCTPSEDTGIRTGRGGYTFVGASADLLQMPWDLQVVLEKRRRGIAPR